jgi:hypothetical protein
MAWRKMTPVALLTWLAGCTVEEPASKDGTPYGIAGTTGGKSYRADAASGATPPPLIAANRPKNPLEVSAALARASDILGMGQPDLAIKILEDVLAVDPANREALGLLVKATQTLAARVAPPESSALYLRSAEAARKVLAIKGELTPEQERFVREVFYNEARTLAAEGEARRAVKSLSDAVDVGFDDPERLGRDPAFEPLRGLPEFQALRQKLGKNAGDKPSPAGRDQAEQGSPSGGGAAKP